MLRVIFGLLVTAGLAFFTYFLIVGSDRNIDGALEDDVDIAENHNRSVDELNELVEESLKNAKRAQELAQELDDAVIAARKSANQVDNLAFDNDAATTSAYAALAASADATDAAELMRQYATNLQGRLENTIRLTEEAREVSAVVEEVERTQAKVREAAEEAEDAREELDEAERELDATVMDARSNLATGSSY